MTAQHTPGPWMWEGNTLRPVNRDHEQSAVHSILDADGGFGFLGSDYRTTLAELDADRLLIAAAPLLLEALQQLVACHDEPTCPALEVARLAIAKATGELA